MLEIGVHNKSNTNTVESSNQYYLPPPPNTERNRRLPLPPSVTKPSAAEQFTSCKFTPLPDPPSRPPPLPSIIHSEETNTNLLCGEYDDPDTPRVRIHPRPKPPKPPPPLPYSNEYETYEYSPMSESHIHVKTVQGVGEINDDLNEYETHSSTNNDNQNKNKDENLIMARKCSITDLSIDKLPGLKYLFTEINNLQKEQSELNYANKLKQKRNTIQEAMINDLRINRSLDLEHETRRKEIEALRSGNVNPENTSDASHVNALINTNHTKVKLDLSEDVLQSLPYIPKLQMERFLSDSSDVMVKLYDHQSFHRVKSSISDRDSAIYFGNYA